MTVQEMGRACMEHALFKRGAGGGKKIAGTAADEQTIKHLLESSAFFRRVASITDVMAASHTTAQKHMRNAARQPSCRDDAPSTARGSLHAMDASAQRSRDLESADSSSGMIYRAMHETQRVM
jgi:hypothetical protein